MRRTSPVSFRWVGSLVVVAAVAAAGAVLATPAAAGSGPHPCFNDQGAIPWYRNLPEAQAAARAAGKLIFIESGRLECSQCRRLVAGIIAYEPVRSRMGAVAIGFADDCDETNPAVQALFEANLPNATMLPLVAFVTPDLQWVTGWSGARMVGPVLDAVSLAETAQRRLLLARAPAAPLASAPCAAGPSCSVPKPAPIAAPLAAATPRPASPVPPARTAIAPTPSPAAVKPPLATAVPPTRDPRDAPRAAAPSPIAPKPPPLARAENSANPVNSANSIPPAPPAPPPAAPSMEPLRPPPARVPTAIERARAAAARESWGEVIRIADREVTASEGPEAVEMEALYDRACAWTLRTMSDAERAAIEHRSADAKKTLERMRKELDGTGSPALVDADRGLRAIDALTALDAGSPDGDEGVETLRRRAYAEFRGSRWAPLFRSR